MVCLQRNLQGSPYDVGVMFLGMSAESRLTIYRHHVFLAEVWVSQRATFHLEASKHTVV